MLDGIRRFLEDHAMQGKTSAREFFAFEKTLHEKMLEAEREIVADVMRAWDVVADAVEIEGRTPLFSSDSRAPQPPLRLATHS